MPKREELERRLAEGEEKDTLSRLEKAIQSLSSLVKGKASIQAPEALPPAPAEGDKNDDVDDTEDAEGVPGEENSADNNDGPPAGADDAAPEDEGEGDDDNDEGDFGKSLAANKTGHQLLESLMKSGAVQECYEGTEAVQQLVDTVIPFVGAVYEQNILLQKSVAVLADSIQAIALAQAETMKKAMDTPALPNRASVFPGVHYAATPGRTATPGVKLPEKFAKSQVAFLNAITEAVSAGAVGAEILSRINTDGAEAVYAALPAEAREKFFKIAQ